MSTPFVCTYTGETVDLFNPDPSTLRVEDFLWAAGNSQRYLGHTKRPYSNLEHAYWVSRFVSPELQRSAILHDWPEIYLADLPGPLKAEFKSRGQEFYDEVESKHETALMQRFNLVFPFFDSEIKQADKLLLWYEGQEVLTTPLSGEKWWSKYKDCWNGWYMGEQQEPPLVLGLGALSSDPDFLRELVRDEFKRLGIS